MPILSALSLHAMPSVSARQIVCMLDDVLLQVFTGDLEAEEALSQVIEILNTLTDDNDYDMS